MSDPLSESIRRKLSANAVTLAIISCPGHPAAFLTRLKQQNELQADGDLWRGTAAGVAILMCAQEMKNVYEIRK